MAGRTKVTKGPKARRIEKNLDDPSAILKSIGALLVADAQQAFKEQQFDKKQWPPRGAVNVMGIISDFAQGKGSPPKRRFETRPALKDTGHLSRSISFKLVGNNRVEVGTNVPYASVHQKGGEVESAKLTNDVVTALAKWLKRKPEGIKAKLGWLLNKKLRNTTIKGRVPARPFIGLTRRTLDYIKKTFGRTVSEVG
jgi:phage gpG-like protein